MSQSVDSAFLQYLIGKTLAKSASVHLLFAFEYIIQARDSLPRSCTKHTVRGLLLHVSRPGFLRNKANVTLIAWAI